MSDGAPHIAWVGDLDGDSRPDFLADLRTDDCGHAWALFLSSAAEGLAPVRVAGLASGCC